MAPPLLTTADLGRSTRALDRFGLVLAAGRVDNRTTGAPRYADLAVVAAGDAGIAVSAGGVQTELPGEHMAVQIAYGGPVLPGTAGAQTWYERRREMIDTP